MYHLRHYAQHHSIPLNNLQVKANRDDPSSPWQFEIGLSTLRDGLLKDGFDWKQARAGIESQSEIFDLQPLVAEYVESLGVLCRGYLESHQQRLVECGRYLGAYVRVFKIPPKSWPVIFVGESQVAGCPPGQVEWVPIGQYQFIIDLLARLPKQDTF